MTVTLYRNNSSPSHVDKNLVQLWQGEGTFRKPVSVLKPSFIVEGDLTSYLNRMNYFFISELSRYYFMSDPVCINKNLYQISGTVDALSSWKDFIRENNAVIYRQENAYNLMLNDGVFKAEQPMMVQRLKWPAGLVDRQFILTVAGGLGTT